MQVEALQMWGGWWPLLTTNVMSEITLSPVRLRRSHTDEGWCKHAVIWPDSLTAAGSILIVERPPRTQILGNICKRGIEPQTTNLATLFLQKHLCGRGILPFIGLSLANTKTRGNIRQGNDERLAEKLHTHAHIYVYTYNCPAGADSSDRTERAVVWCGSRWRSRGPAVKMQ